MFKLIGSAAHRLSKAVTERHTRKRAGQPPGGSGARRSEPQRHPRALWAVAVAGAMLVAPLRAIGPPASALTDNGGPPPGMTASVINAGAGDQTDPHISGGLVSYANQVGGVSEIRYHDLATGTDKAIPNGGALDFLSDVSGNTIVFTRIVGTKRAVYSYDTATSGPATELDPQPGSHRVDAAIGGTTVAWEDRGWDFLKPELAIYDLSGRVVTRITEDALYDYDPAVSPDGSVVVWTSCLAVGSNCDIWQATRGGAVWTTTQLTGAEGDEDRAATNGQVVVYDSLRDGDRDIFWQPVGGGPERRLSLAGSQSNPSVSGSLIVLEAFDSAAATPNSDLVAYDLATDTLYRLTNTPTNEVLNNISVTGGTARVVYARQDPGGEYGDYNVFALTFPVPGQVTYSADFHAPIDDAPTVNIAKGGRVIPINVEVFKNDVEDKTGPVSLQLKTLDCPSGVPGDTVETDAPGSSNTANQFRWDATSDRWSYHLATQKVSTDTCFKGEVYLGGTPDATGKVTGGNLAGHFLLKLTK